MSRIEGARAELRRWVRSAGFVGITAVIVPPFAAQMRHTRAEGRARVEVRDRWVRVWARSQLRLFNIRLAVEGGPGPGRLGGRGRLIVANHRSAADIGVILSLLGGSMVSRADLADWPLLGPGARVAETLFVDRSLPESGATLLRSLQRRLKEGHTVCVFPEGTTLDGDEVRPFHRGAFAAALLAKAEVLPVGLAFPAAAQAAFLDEAFGEHLARLARGPGFPVGVGLGAPLLPNPGERAAELAERARLAVAEQVARARVRIGG